MAASTAYACVAYYGELTVTGSVRASNLMIADEGQHDYCTGYEPTTAAAGPAGSTVSAQFDPASDCNANGTNQLPDGTYDIALRNTKNGYTGADGSGWTQVSLSGCWSGKKDGTIYSLGTVSISSGSGSGSWTIPSTATTNGTTDASVFCAAKQPASGSQPGFLAPFRVSTV